MNPTAKPSAQGTPGGKLNPAQFFDWIYSTLDQYPVIDEVRAEIYGAEFVAEIDNYSYLTRTELQWIEDELQLSAGDRLLDVGCGKGGPGLWVANRTAVHLTGIDHSAVAVAKATNQAKRFDHVHNPRFVAADVADLEVEERSFDAAMSIDVLQLVVRLPEALSTLARVLKPGGRLAFSAFESPTEKAAAGKQRYPADFRPLLRDAGFDVHKRDTPAEAEQLMRRYCQGMLDHAPEVEKQLGTRIRDHFVRSTQDTIELLDSEVRVLISAVRH